MSRFLTADTLQNDELSYINAPEGGVAAELSFSISMVAIDELGATFRSPHVIPKGTVFHAEGEPLTSILGAGKRQLMSVVSTEVFTDSTGYKVMAEFDEPSEGLLTSVRRWIRSQPR
jgi:hypothetical protein